jgi:hypothetical protein
MITVRRATFAFLMAAGMAVGLVLSTDALADGASWGTLAARIGGTVACLWVLIKVVTED